MIRDPVDVHGCVDRRAEGERQGVTTGCELGEDLQPDS
jgi:hypothetical protein